MPPPEITFANEPTTIASTVAFTRHQSPLAALQVEHIRSRKHGGDDTLDNLRWPVSTAICTRAVMWLATTLKPSN